MTVARFRKDLAAAVPALFAEVLGLCARLGMGKVGVVALDGTKIAASASRAANRAEVSLRKMAEEAAAAHAAAGEAEDALFGDGRGDDDPGDPRTRAERVAAALASARAERERREAQERAKADEHVRAAEAGTPKAGPRPHAAQVELARQHAAREMARQQDRVSAWERRRAADGSRTGRRPVPPEQHCRVREAQARLAEAVAAQSERDAARQAAGKDGQPLKRNITDPDSRLMPVRGGGFTQGYNAQNVTSSDGLIIATRLTQDTTDTPWYEPMIAAAARAAASPAGGFHDRGS